MAFRVELSAEAVSDLMELGPDRNRVESFLKRLAEDPRPANLDIKPLRGRAPWSRGRVGSYRAIFRALTAAECVDLGEPGARGYLVARVVRRRDLERIVRGL